MCEAAHTKPTTFRNETPKWYCRQPMSASPLRLRCYSKTPGVSTWETARSKTKAKRKNGVRSLSFSLDIKTKTSNSSCYVEFRAATALIYNSAREYLMRLAENTKNASQLWHGERGAAFWFIIKARKQNLRSFPKCCGALLFLSQSSSIACHGSRGRIYWSILAARVASFIPQLPVYLPKLFGYRTWKIFLFRKRLAEKWNDLLSRTRRGFMDSKSKSWQGLCLSLALWLLFIKSWIATRHGESVALKSVRNCYNVASWSVFSKLKVRVACSALPPPRSKNIHMDTTWLSEHINTSHSRLRTFILYSTPSCSVSQKAPSTGPCLGCFLQNLECELWWRVRLKWTHSKHMSKQT